MPTFLQLPLEVLDAIAELTIPEDFEAFEATCRTTYAACGRFRLTHRSNREGWRHFDVKQRGRISPSLHLLKDIVKKPILGRYVQKADLRPMDENEGDGAFWNGWEDEDDLEIPKRRQKLGGVSDELLQEIKKLVFENPIVLAANVYVEDFWTALEREVADPDTGDLLLPIFVLTLLPNLRVLALPGSYPNMYDEGLDDWKLGIPAAALLKVMVRQILRGVPDVPLSKLECLLPVLAEVYVVDHALEAFIPFLALPTLKTASLANCSVTRDCHTGILFPDESTAIGQNLESLELWSCTLNTSEMTTLLQGMQMLRTLKIYHEQCSEATENMNQWSAGSFMEAICTSPVANTLEHLILDTRTPRGRMVTGVTNLKPLHNLKTLVLNICCLNGPPLPPHLADEDLDDTNDYLGRAQIPMLHELIPESLEQLDLYSDVWVGEDDYDDSLECAPMLLQQLFSDFDMDRYANHNLKRINVRISPEGYEHVPVQLDDLPRAQEWSEAAKAIMQLGGTFWRGVDHTDWAYGYSSRYEYSFQRPFRVDDASVIKP